MLKIEINASIRKETKKGAMRQLRLQGMTPAVVYGGGSEAVPLKLDTRSFYQQLLDVYRKNAIVSLNLDDGTTKHVLIHEVQTDPVKDTLVHADFIEIDVKKPRVFEVPITYKGSAPGVEMGGVLNTILHTLAIESAPMDVPDEFVVDISGLGMNESIQVNTIDIPGNVTLVSDPEGSCVSVVSIAQEASAEEDGEDAAEDAGAGGSEGEAESGEETSEE
jgi:large subunit ribosomal protein L25